MSGAMYIDVIVNKDADFDKMKAVCDACSNADIPIPDIVMNYFNGDMPTDEGLVYRLPYNHCNINDTKNSPALAKYITESREGFDIELAKLPFNARLLRVYMSY